MSINHDRLAQVGRDVGSFICWEAGQLDLSFDTAEEAERYTTIRTIAIMRQGRGVVRRFFPRLVREGA